MSNTFYCPNCNCDKKRNEIVDFPTNWGGFLIVLKGVPIIKCDNCSEIFLKSGITRLSQKIAKVFSENLRLTVINELNISEIVTVVKTSDQQDYFIDALSKNIIKPKKIGEGYRITKADALCAINFDQADFDLAARDGKIDSADLKKIEEDIERE